MEILQKFFRKFFATFHTIIQYNLYHPQSTSVFFFFLFLSSILPYQKDTNLNPPIFITSSYKQFHPFQTRNIHNESSDEYPKCTQNGGRKERIRIQKERIEGPWKNRTPKVVSAEFGIIEHNGIRRNRIERKATKQRKRENSRDKWVKTWREKASHILERFIDAQKTGQIPGERPGCSSEEEAKDEGG